MSRARKVVLAYSGGVDTTACIPYLKHEMGCETVIAMTADLGQGEELGPIQEKALEAGADVSLVVDVRETFIRDYGFPALKANALYDGRYPLSSALGRPLIGNLLVQMAHEYGCDGVAHGCTGKGNDQVRLDLTVTLLDSSLQILAPAREWGFSRAETVAYSESYGIPSHVTKEKPWAIDLNLLGRNVEAGLIEDLSWEPTEEIWALTCSPQDAPNTPQYVDITFDRGYPVAVNGEHLDPVSLIETLNKIGGENAIGRIDMLENRVVGIKSREIYEAPAQMILLRAHEELEALTLPADVMKTKRALEISYSQLIYDGLWHSHLKRSLDAFIDVTQETVTGEIRLKLYKGGMTVARRAASQSLYRIDLVTYGSDCTFNLDSAKGFIDLFGLPSRVWTQSQKGQNAMLAAVKISRINRRGSILDLSKV